MGKQVILEDMNMVVQKAICTHNDDEGANNNADIDRWYINFDAYNAKVDPTKPDGVELQAITTGQKIVAWETSGDVGVWVNYEWDFGDLANRSANVKFTDGNGYDFDKAQLTLHLSQREYDAGSSDEWGSATQTLIGRGIYGIHKIYVGSSDAGFDVYIDITEVP